MRISILTPFVLILILGCAKQQPSPQPIASPSEVVTNVYRSIAKQDTATFLNLLCGSQRHRFAEHPTWLHSAMASWSGRTPTVQIISESHDSTIALVNYHLKVTGKNSLDTNYSTQLYLEDGSWKFGY